MTTFVHYEDLMKECNINDLSEFRRLLKRNGLTSISLNKPISKKEATKIVKRLTGQTIDWYKYKGNPGVLDGGNLDHKITEADKEFVVKWYSRLNIDINTVSQNRLLGLAFLGGFLRGKLDNEFVLKLESGINILIGDRGAGKSTFLHLSGLLADSVSEETDDLVRKVMTLLNPDSEEKIDITRRIRKILSQYSVKKYACFFTSNQKVYCYYVDLSKKMSGLLEYVGDKWISTDVIVRPNMIVLQQGEVIQIAEKRNQYYLNNILDALYPDLHKKRIDFAEEIKNLTNQFEYYKKSFLKFDTREINRFIDKKQKELRTIFIELKRGIISDESIMLIKSYIERYYEIKNNLNISIADLQSKPIFELLTGNEDTFYYLYLGKIIGFLSRAIVTIEAMRKEQLEEIQESYNNILDREVLETISIDKEVLEKFAQPFGELEEERIEGELFLQALELEEKSPVYRELFKLMRQVLDFLHIRLRILENWVEIYSRGIVCLDKALVSLINGYINLLNRKIELIREQEEKCLILKDILNKDNLEIDLYTIKANDNISKHKFMIDNLEKIYSLENGLMSTTIESWLEALRDLSSSYNNIIRKFLENLRKMKDEVMEEQNNFIFDSIEVELRQGNIYRSFYQLSFGQKSGIILKMVLSSSNKNIIIIDQPEDNLDAHSIVNMLAPLLNRLQKDHQIIIATHDSKLVMGLETNKLVVFESMGENGRVKIEGSPSLQKDVIREMFDVLEGGIPTFEMRIKIYEKFISRVSGSIKDLDISMIESSFRRRTIDGLRSFLQPVICDRDFLNFTRHALKQYDSSRIQKDIVSVKEEINVVKQKFDLNLDNIIEKLDKLMNNLKSHIEKLTDSIEEIRLMDVEAKPELVDLYELLQEFKKDYLAKPDSNIRKIHIDINLKGQVIYIDRGHSKLIFKNLLDNVFRATETRVLADFMANRTDEETNEDDKAEIVHFKLNDLSDNHLILLLKDNGCGIQPDIMEKLYIERCSNQPGRDHGLGGVTIRKLLDLNGGSIQVLGSNNSNVNSGTLQKIILRRKSYEKNIDCR